jgi:hypothetical protein
MASSSNDAFFGSAGFKEQRSSHMNKTGKDTAGAGVAKVRATTGNDNIGFLI